MKAYFTCIFAFFFGFNLHAQTGLYSAELLDKRTFVFRNHSPFALKFKIYTEGFKVNNDTTLVEGESEKAIKINKGKIKEVEYQVFYSKSAYDERKNYLEKKTENLERIFSVEEKEYLDNAFNDIPAEIAGKGVENLDPLQILAGIFLELKKEPIMESIFGEPEHKKTLEELTRTEIELGRNQSIYESQPPGSNNYTNQFIRRTVEYKKQTVTPVFTLGYFWPSSYQDLSNEWVTKGITGRFGLDLGISISPEIRLAKNFRSRLMFHGSYYRLGFVPNKNLTYFVGKEYINSSLDDEHFLLKNTDRISLNMNELSAGVLLVNNIGKLLSLDFGVGVKSLMKSYYKFDQTEVTITGRNYNLINDKIKNIASTESDYVPYVTSRISLGNAPGFFAGITFYNNTFVDEFNHFYVANSSNPNDAGFAIQPTSFQNKSLNYHFNFGLLFALR